MNTKKDEHGEYVLATDIDNELHQRIYKEVKKFPIEIFICYIMALGFVLLGVFLGKYILANGVANPIGMIVGYVILFFAVLLSGGRGLSIQLEYRKFKKRKYKCYMLKVASFLNNYQLLVKEGFDKEIDYNSKQFSRTYSNEMEYEEDEEIEESNTNNEVEEEITVMVVEFDGNLYAFDPEYVE